MSPPSLPRKLARPIVRFTLRHWVRHDEFVRLRQQIRYLSLAHLMWRSGSSPRDLTMYELSLFSQNGEDGVIQEILNRIGPEGRTFVEIGASLNESNCQYLADACGWTGMFVDADSNEVDALKRKYRRSRRVKVVQSFVTQENINSLITDNGLTSIDVLSIDVDGNDYWLWLGMTTIRPRLVIIECNASLGDKPLVQRYSPHSSWDGSNSFGASITALSRLAEAKGYQLVHVELTGTNAIFVRNDLAGPHFVPPDQVVDRVPNYFLYGLSHPLSNGSNLEDLT